MKKVLVLVFSVVMLATTFADVNAYIGSQGDGEAEIRAEAYGYCVVSIPAVCDFTQQSEADISVDEYNLDTNNSIVVFANNINDDNTLTVYHTTKENVTANLTLNRLGDDSFINDTNIVQQSNPILARFTYDELEAGNNSKQFGGYFMGDVSAGCYSGVMSYSIYIEEVLQ